MVEFAASAIHWLFGQYVSYTPLFIILELVAVVFGVASVLLARRTNILVYPVGLVSTGIFVYLLWAWQLYGDMLMNAYYSVMSLYGWYHWLHHRDVMVQDDDHISARQSVRIERLTTSDIPILSLIMVITAALVGIIYYFRPIINNGFEQQDVELGLHLFTWVDYTDMVTTALFGMAMWLMARRKIENWLLWIIADAISVPLYFYKGYTFTAIQYMIFTLIAIWAYQGWQRRLHRQTSIVAPCSMTLPNTNHP